jgi:hypothetical protein
MSRNGSISEGTAGVRREREAGASEREAIFDPPSIRPAILPGTVYGVRLRGRFMR